MTDFVEFSSDLLQASSRSDVVYTDAVSYPDSQGVVALEASKNALITRALIRPTSFPDAEELAIALALTQSASKIKLAGSQAACRRLLSGQVDLPHCNF